ncbi:MAG: hypothetical protein LLG04_08695, partial [Parachlamydia sp.]|nr:hypothetical protein [Parachlamydia sp.]
FFHWLPRVGSEDDRVTVTFTLGVGNLTHGSFALIQSQESGLSSNILETSDIDNHCLYADNTHNPCQWWTVKSADHPFLGAPIQYGDRVYLENHIYIDLFQYVPARLVKSDLLSMLTTAPITDSSSDSNYWILEKVE